MSQLFGAKCGYGRQSNPPSGLEDYDWGFNLNFKEGGYQHPQSNKEQPIQLNEMPTFRKLPPPPPGVTPPSGPTRNRSAIRTFPGFVQHGKWEIAR